MRSHRDSGKDDKTISKMKSEKLMRAKISLIYDEPFWATVMLGMKWSETTTETKTAATNGKKVVVNPAFFDALPFDEQKAVIAHEVAHVTFGHHTRQGNRDHEKWNIACDYAINPILVKCGFKLPASALLNPIYENMTAEEIYSKLPPGDKDDEGGDGNGAGPGTGTGSPDPGGCGTVSQPDVTTKAELEQIEAETKQLVAQAAMTAKQAGKLPAHLERLIEEIMQPKVNWKDVLCTFLQEVSKNDYTFSRPNKRYLQQGLYLPALHSVERGKFVMIVDTSGSIDAKQLNEFAAEIQSILSDTASELTVIYCDTEVDADRVQTFEADETCDLKPDGGGGTDFKPGFEYIDEQGIEAKAVVYFTDGYCNSFPERVEVPTIWAVYGDNKNFAPPFGEVIHIED